MKRALLTLIAAVPLSIAAEVLDIGQDGLKIPPITETIYATARDIELLRDAISREGYVPRKAQLLQELAKVDPHAAKDLLLQASEDSSPLMRAAAARAVCADSDSLLIDSLSKLLRDNDAEVRIEAARSAGCINRATLLAEAMSDESIAVRRVAIAGCDTIEEGQSLVDRWEQIPATLRPEAIGSLAASGNTAAEKLIIASLNADEQEQIAGIRAAARLKLSAAGDVIDGLVSSGTSSVVRREALLATPLLSTPSRAQALAMDRLQDPDLTVRTAAAEVLRQLPVAAAVPQLVENLVEPSNPLRTKAREALVSTGAAAVPISVELLPDANAERRKDGSWILGHLKSSDGIEQHLNLLKDVDFSVCAQAAESLGVIGNPLAADPVMDLLTRCSPLTRDNSRACREAIIACGRLKVVKALPSITPLLANSDPGTRPVRVAAVWAFGVLGESSDTANCNRLIGLINDIYEVDEVKFEAIKALGQLKYTPAGESLLAWSKGEQVGESASLRWMAHWSFERVSGQTVPYEPPRRELRPDTSIQGLR